MVFCLQDIVYYVKNRGNLKSVPWFSILVLAYLTSIYVTWTSSCFDWRSEVQSPYLYFSVINSLLLVFFTYGAEKHYGGEKPSQESKSAPEMRFQVLIQAVITIVIVGICAIGFFTAFRIKKAISNGTGLFRNADHMVAYLFGFSFILILLVVALIYAMTSRYRRIMKLIHMMDDGNSSRFHFIFTVVLTLALMLFTLIYNSVVLYNSSVVSVYEDGKESIKTTATELENYLTVGYTTLRVTADSVELMVKNGNSTQEIEKFIIDQTTKQAEEFDENFTGIYALIDGQYLDGLEWVPPEGYVPTA
jgi:hypothetical protein